MISNVIFKSTNDEWATPEEIFHSLDDEFHFTLDPCATNENHKCVKYYTQKENGLSRDWSGESVFCNPPYSNIKSWVAKAFYETKSDHTVVVMLVPARTDTKWFQDYVYHRAEVRFVKGRLKFAGAKNTAPFPSMIVIFRGAKA